MIGLLAASLFLAGASYFDVKTAGEAIPLSFLKAWFASSIIYAAYSAYVLLKADSLLVLQTWGFTIVVSSLIALTLERLRVCGEADCWGLVSTTIFNPFLALPSFLFAAIAHLAAYAVPLITLNMMRREKTVPWWAYGWCVRLTPRLLRIPFVKWRRNPAGQLAMMADAETIRLDARAGDLASPFLFLLPFYFAAVTLTWLWPPALTICSWLNIDPATVRWLLEKLP
jgi:hypothetical protein